MTPASPGQKRQVTIAKGARREGTKSPGGEGAVPEYSAPTSSPKGDTIRQRYSMEPEGLAYSPTQGPEERSAPGPAVGELHGTEAPGPAQEAGVGRSARPVPVQLYRWLDSALALGALIVALVARNVGRMAGNVEGFLAIRLSIKNVLLLLCFLAAWRAICALCGLYDLRRIAVWGSEVRRILTACLLGGIVALAFPLTSASGAFDYLALTFFLAGATIGMLGLRGLLRFAARVRPRPTRNVLIVGSGPRALRMKEDLQADPHTDYRVLGFVDSYPSLAPGEIRQRIVATLEEFAATLMRSPVDEVVVALPMKSHYAQMQHIVEFCESIGVAVTLPADAFPSSRSVFRPRPSPTMVAVTLTDGPDRARLLVKRMLDMTGAGLLLIAVSPLMLVTAALVKLTSRGPVLFSQERYGYNRRIFRMHKFRTMVVDAEHMQSALEHLNEAPGPLFKIKRDPRLTFIGGLLRRTSIDELPQLFNVLRGDMSLVGPRPMAIRDVHRFPEATLMRRFSVPAGMTGLWQVTGRSMLNYDQWAACDLRYVDRWSLLEDFKILALTIPAVVRGTGAQ